MGPATRFVSHAWSYPLVDLLDALYAHGAATPNAEDEYLWVGACRLDTFTTAAHAHARNMPRHICGQPAQSGQA